MSGLSGAPGCPGDDGPIHDDRHPPDASHLPEVRNVAADPQSIPETHVVHT